MIEQLERRIRYLETTLEELLKALAKGEQVVSIWYGFEPNVYCEGSNQKVATASEAREKLSKE